MELFQRSPLNLIESKKRRLGKIRYTPGGPKKFAVDVKNDKGNVVTVRFGSPSMEIKRDNPKRLKNFRARHNCDTPGPRWKARYWACKTWRRGKSVSSMVKEEKDSCYHSVKARYKVFPSARASQAIAKCRKKKGNVRKGSKGKLLKRWQKEKWVDTKSGKACGAGGDNEYCRPSKRVSKKTPVTVKELGRNKLQAKKAEKSKVGMGARVKPVKRK